jgi:signal transduction histidine kinase/ActR/RegA family two-component response regulator
MTEFNKAEIERLRQKAEELSAVRDTSSKITPSLSEVDMLRLIHELEVHQIELELQYDELQRAKTAADIATSKYSDLYDFSPSGYFTLSKLGEVTELNLTGAKMLGTVRSKQINRSFDIFVSPESKPVFNQFLDKVFQSKVLETCENIVLKDECLPTYVLLTGLISENEEQCNITMVDITERKQGEEANLHLEQQLQHAQKLESLGVLSGGIAHDFNNILTIIVGYCGLTKMNYESAKKNIPQIEKAAERAAVLCRQMMAYAGKAQLTMTEVNMVTQIEETVDMLRATSPQNAVITSEFSANIPIIRGDPGQLHQVLMNLIINASESLGTKQGEVNVSLAKFEVVEGLSFEDHFGELIAPGEYVCLEVTDNGCGMDDDTKRKLFEPFFTTKFVGRGLGMAAVIGIIHSHGGNIALFSRLGQGTTFKVYLPVLVGKLSGSSDEVSSNRDETTWQGSGTILLAEDEEQVRFITKESLEMLGFTVLEAVNGKEALELYQTNAEDITLVLTDVGMPIMDGYELIDELKKLKPELPIIIFSGYADTEIKTRRRGDNIAGIISKPYNLDKFREVLKIVAERRVRNQF